MSRVDIRAILQDPKKRSRLLAESKSIRAVDAGRYIVTHPKAHMIHYNVKLYVGTDNMKTRADVAQALENLARELRYVPNVGLLIDHGTVRDLRGSVVGEWKVTKAKGGK